MLLDTISQIDCESCAEHTFETGDLAGGDDSIWECAEDR
jgi:hypothetical protein